MKGKGRKNQTGGSTKIQVCTVYDSETVARIDKLAEDGGKSRSLMMSELVKAGLPVLEAEKRAEKDGLSQRTNGTGETKASRGSQGSRGSERQ